MDSRGSGTSFPLSRMLTEFKRMCDDLNREQRGLGTMLMGSYVAQVKCSIAVANALAGIHSDIDTLVRRESESNGKPASAHSASGASVHPASILSGSPATAAPSTKQDFCDCGDAMDCIPRKAKP